MSNDILEVLNVSLDLVRIPRTRVSSLVSPILRQVLSPQRTFLALTANEIELSVFGENAALDFAAVAQRDRRKRLQTAASTSWEAVEVSTDKWKVIQIPSPDDSGAHLHEVSAPIATAGISILYHSSHQNDFIFVKESRLRDVLILLAGVGFMPLDVADFSPGSERSQSYSELGLSNSSSGPLSGTVLTRHSNSVSPANRPRSGTTSSGLSLASCKSELDLPSFPTTSATAQGPAAADVRILSPDLTCIGLPPDAENAWALKVVKLITCPDLIGTIPSKSALEGLALEFDSPFADFVASDSDSPSSSPDSSENEDEDEIVPRNGFDTEIAEVPRLSSSSTLLPSGSAAVQDDPRSPFPSQSRIAPYYSFTRAPEGSSLTAGVTLLSALFPSDEREGLSCADALDTPDASDASEAFDDNEAANSTLPRVCLQVDLRQSPLDSHGLVHRFATALAEHEIEHVYSSTFKTANILVNRKDAEKARSLLALC